MVSWILADNGSYGAAEKDLASCRLWRDEVTHLGHEEKTRARVAYSLGDFNLATISVKSWAKLSVSLQTHPNHYMLHYMLN